MTVSSRRRLSARAVDAVLDARELQIVDMAKRLARLEAEVELAQRAADRRRGRPAP